MKSEDCTMDTPVALDGTGDRFKRGKIVGPVTNTPKGKQQVLVEWTRGAIQRVSIDELISIEQAEEQEAEAMAEEKRLQAAQAELEYEFEETFNRIHPQIQEKMAQAAKLIEEATALSEEHGIPFRPKNGTPFRMSYIPSSLRSKWKKLLSLDEGYDYVFDVANASGDTQYGGWQSSQVC